MLNKINENDRSLKLSNISKEDVDYDVEIKNEFDSLKKEILKNKISAQAGVTYLKMEKIDSDDELDKIKNSTISKLDELDDVADEAIDLAAKISSGKIPEKGAEYDLAKLYFFGKLDKYEKDETFYFLDKEKRKPTSTKDKFDKLRDKIINNKFSLMMDYFQQLSIKIENFDAATVNEFKKEIIDEIKKEFLKTQDEFFADFGNSLREPINIEADKKIIGK